MKKLIIALLLSIQSIKTDNLSFLDFLHSIYKKDGYTGEIDHNLTRSRKMTEDEPNTIKVAVIELSSNPDFNHVAMNILTAAKSPDFAGIIMYVDNYGGPAGPYSYIHDLVKRAAATKPTVALIRGGAASGGYLVVSATNYIIASSLANIGSVGVVQEIHKHKNVKLDGDVKADLEIEVFSAGQYKTVTHPYTKSLTDEDKENIKQDLDSIYKQFIAIVAENRNLNIDEYATWAEGRVFKAAQAKQVGLIDEIGTMFEAEDKIIELVRHKSPDGNPDLKVSPVFFSERPDEDKK